MQYSVAFPANAGANVGANDIPFFNASFPARNVTCGIAAIKSLRIPPDCIILDNCVFENVILADEISQMFETYLSVNNPLFEKLASSLKLLKKFDERFKVTSVSFFLQILTY